MFEKTERLGNIRKQEVNDLPEEMIFGARTFQQLAWVAERKRTEDMPSVLEKEIWMLESEECWEEAEHNRLDLYNYPEIRNSPFLLGKVKELIARRNEMNSEYREKIPVTFAPGSSEMFSVHAVNLENREGSEMSDHPIIIAPGFAVGHEAVRRNAIGLAELGHSSLTFDVPPETTAYDPSISFPNNTPAFTKHHATALLHTIDAANEKVFEKPRTYNVIGYSYGAIVAIHAALAEPEKFHSIVLINPGGLTHVDDPYLVRFIKLVLNSRKHRQQVLQEAAKSEKSYADLLENMVRPDGKQGLGHTDRDAKFHDEFSTEMNEIAKQGGLPLALRTASAISQADLVPLIRELDSKGVKIGILAAEDDPLFPVDLVEKSGKSAGVPTYITKGAHANLGFNPGHTSELCVDLFHELDPEGERK